MTLPASIEDDIKPILRDYELRDTGITQFYVASTRDSFEKVMEEVGRRAGVIPEKRISHTLTRTSGGGIR